MSREEVEGETPRDGSQSHTCQWEDYGRYPCDNEAEEVLTVMGKQIPLCGVHLSQFRSTQL